MNKRGLGKGLEALFDTTSIKTDYGGLPESVLNNENNEFEEIDVDKIDPNELQPRRIFDKEALLELAESIKENGVIQPLIVRKKKDGYELAAGERRWRASRLAGLKTVPAIVRQYTDAQMLEIALIENLQRQDLNAIEEARAFHRLMKEFGLTQEEIAQKINRSRPMISNSVRLLKLNPEIQNFILHGTMTAGQAKPLLAIEDEALQLDLAVEAINGDYSAREIEELVRKVASRRQSQDKEPPKDKKTSGIFEEEFYMNECEDRLKLLLGTQVRIRPGKQKSKIEIEFYSNEDLERIIEAVSTNADKLENSTPNFKGKLVV